MQYKISNACEINELGDNEGAIYFDSKTLDTHVLDEVAANILKCFQTEPDADKVIDKLAEMYEEDRAVIESDVRVFISELVQKGILEAVN